MKIPSSRNRRHTLLQRKPTRDLAKTTARDETNMSTIWNCTRKLPQHDHALFLT